MMTSNQRIYLSYISLIYNLPLFNKDPLAGIWYLIKESSLIINEKDFQYFPIFRNTALKLYETNKKRKN